MSVVRQIGPWVLGDTLGAGGFSKVKLGMHEKTKEKVALKILKKDKLAMTESVKKQVEREVAALQKIKHPNVIRLLDVEWDGKYPKKNGKFYDCVLVVLELATGGELFEFLSYTGSFEEAIARTYFHQLISAMEACHKVGVAHRDLKPENVLLDNQFMLKLADFGLSNVFTQNMRLMYTECGTPGYMAPEMAKKRGYDPTSGDIWAAGVVLFIMISGFPPFQRPDDTDWWFQKLNSNKHNLFWQAHSRTAYFTEPFKDLINKILCPDPQKRISIAQIQKHEWFLGRTLSDEALKSELQRRKATVNEEKAREKLEKKKQSGHGGGLEQTTMRGTLGVEVDLPTSPPSLCTVSAFGGLGPQVHMEEDESSSSLGGFSQVDSFGGFSEVEKKDVAPAQYVESDSTQCYTRFYTNKRAAKALDRVCAVMTNMGSQQQSVKDQEYKVKATFVTENGTIAVHAQIFTDPHSNLLICEFRRRQGDALQYRHIYNAIRGDLSDIAVAPPTNAKEAQAPDAKPEEAVKPVEAA